MKRSYVIIAFSAAAGLSACSGGGAISAVETAPAAPAAPIATPIEAPAVKAATPAAAKAKKKAAPTKENIRQTDTISSIDTIVS